jgi:hypothetical protein
MMRLRSPREVIELAFVALWQCALVWAGLRAVAADAPVSNLTIVLVCLSGMLAWWLSRGLRGAPRPGVGVCFLLAVAWCLVAIANPGPGYAKGHDLCGVMEPSFPSGIAIAALVVLPIIYHVLGTAFWFLGVHVHDWRTARSL